MCNLGLAGTKVEGRLSVTEPLKHEQDVVAPTGYQPDWELLRLKIRSFDPVSLWSRVARDMELLDELVDLFTEEAALMMASIEAAVETGDASGLYKFSHKLRGSVVQFSASAAAGTAGKLEQMGKAGSLEGAPPPVPHLKPPTSPLLDALNLLMCP